LGEGLIRIVTDKKMLLKQQQSELDRGLRAAYQSAQFRLQATKRLLEAYDPVAALQRGYALVRAGGQLVKRVGQLEIGAQVELTLSDGVAHATIVDKEKT